MQVRSHPLSTSALIFVFSESWFRPLICPNKLISRRAGGLSPLIILIDAVSRLAGTV